MDLAHLHLLLNHFPIIGTMLGTVLLLYALLKKEGNLQRAVLVIWVLMAALTPIVMNTGEEAEEKVEEMAGIQEDAIKEHEEAAEYASWLMIGLGVLSLASLVLYKMNSSITKATWICFFLSLLVITAMVRTGYLGGLIRHTENAATISGKEIQAQPAPEEGDQ
jgi:uncharacterized membrane protein